MAIEWIRGRFVSLVESFYETVEIDTSDLLGKLGAMNDPEEVQRMLGDGEADASSLIKASSDPARLADIQAFTAFIEGYGDRLVRVAGGELLPTIARIEEAYTTRRTEPNQAEQFLQQFAGLTLERWRAKDAAAFCDEVVERWGEDTLATVWDEPDNMPTLAELTDPIGWAARVMLDEASFGDDIDTALDEPVVDEDGDDAGSDDGESPTA
jgi:putative hydrolase